MEDNVGTIVIGTKVNNKGLKSDLKETEQIVKNFDDNTEISPQVKVDTEKLDKETEKALKKIDKRIENKELKISYDGGGKAFVAGEIWEEYEAGNEELYQQWYNAQHTKEQLKEIEQITAEINAKTNDQLKDEAIKRGEYYKQLEILEEQKQAQQDLARYNETKERLTKQYEVPDLQFDVGIDESQFDATLNEMKFKAEDILHDISKAINRRDEIIENIAGIEKEIAVYEREHELLLDDALEFQRLNELKAQGVQLSESENKTLEGLQRRASTLNIIATEYNNLINAQVKAQEKLEEQSYETDKLVRKFGILVQKGKEYAEQMNKTDTSKIVNSIETLGGKFTKVIGKVGKLAIALMGVRTILSILTQSFSTLSEYNTELANKIQSIKLVLAVALEPVINWLVNAIQTILGYINAILKAFFGIDLYGRANALTTEKMAKNLSSGAGSAKEMRKQLAGFDEMNVLNDNVAGSGGGGGGFDNFEFNLPEYKVPEFFQWLIDNKEQLMEAGAILSGIVAPPVGGFLLLADGLGHLKKAIDEYFEDPSLENFGEIINRVGESVMGLGMTFNQPVISIIGATGIISGELLKIKDDVDEKTKEMVNDIYEQADWLGNNVSQTMGAMWKNLGEDIDYAETDFYDFWKEVQTDFDNISGAFKKFKEGDIEGGLNDLSNFIKDKWDNEKIRLQKAIDNIKTKLSNLWNGIKIDVENVTNWIKRTWERVKDFFGEIGVKIGDAVGGAVKGAVNGALSWIQNKINDFIRMINNAINIINNIPGVKLSKVSYISLPRLATGGIINQPGRGVPVGGAIAGESSREGILPLTDHRAMQELGKEIGKWITIQNTTPVYIGNRQIARVINEINADREFATNGG